MMWLLTYLDFYETIVTHYGRKKVRPWFMSAC